MSNTSQANNLEHINPTPQNRTSRNHAIVIGASMAGLLTARVLMNYFDRVTLIERDELTEQAELRRGVPQAGHAHVLLTKGQQILQDFFPGIGQDLAEIGAPVITWSNALWFGMYGWMPRVQSYLRGYSCSRVGLETIVRRRLLAYDNLKLLSGYQVKNLLTDEQKSRVTGVQYQSLHAPETKDLTADLVVDASGRNSTLPKWLEAIGYEVPKETIVNSFLGYSTRWYQRPTNFPADQQAIMVVPKPPEQKRGGLLVETEGDRWVVTLVGMSRDYPPTNEAEFLEFAKSLRHPILYEAIKAAKPLTPIAGYRRTENCWKHYEHLKHLPDGVVVLGDAVCAFNPVYGQGMTTAALSAMALDRFLQQQSPQTFTGSTQTFQKQLAEVLQTPWMMATSDDYRWHGVEGDPPSPMMRVMHLYMNEVLELSTSRPDIWRTFLEVAHMMKPPSVLFQPKVAFSVLLNQFQKHLPASNSPHWQSELQADLIQSGE